MQPFVSRTLTSRHPAPSLLALAPHRLTASFPQQQQQQQRRGLIHFLRGVKKLLFGPSGPAAASRAPAPTATPAAPKALQRSAPVLTTSNTTTQQRDDALRARHGELSAGGRPGLAACPDQPSPLVHRDGAESIYTPGLHDSLPDRDLLLQYELLAADATTAPLASVFPLGADATPVLDGPAAVHRLATAPEPTIATEEALHREFISHGVPTATPSSPAAAARLFPGAVAGLTDAKADRDAIRDYNWGENEGAAAGTRNVNASGYKTAAEQDAEQEALLAETCQTPDTAEKEAAQEAVAADGVWGNGGGVPSRYRSPVLTPQGTHGRLGFDVARGRETAPPILHGEGYARSGN